VKRLIALTILLMMLTGVVTAAEEITFRGLEWYATKAEVEQILFADGAKEAGWSSSDNDIYRMSATDYSNVTSGSNRVDDGGVKGWYKGIKIAGHTPSDTYACYMYPVEDGKLVRDDDKTEFYFGWYTFDRSDFSNHAAIFEDLLTKLASIYGEPESETTKYNTQKRWYDSAGNMIRLFINTDKDYVTLGYIAFDAEERLEKLQAAIDVEKAAAEAEELKKIQDNTDGL
jgi:hypothetical protein